MGFGAAIAILLPQVAIASNCPHTIETITEKLLEDLPSYANRVIQRTKLPSRTQSNSTYFIVAGQPNFNPLKQNQQGTYTPAFPQTENETVKQIFFTTLERQYGENGVHSVESYHWLFLTKTEQGWYMTTLYSRFGLGDKNHPPTPPQEVSNGLVGTAIQLWLRDCRFQ